MQSGDLLITKRHWGAFAQTPLEEELRSRGVETIVLAGIATNIGVESTLRQALALAFTSSQLRTPAPLFHRRCKTSPLRRSSRDFRMSALHSRSSKRLPSLNNVAAPSAKRVTHANLILAICCMSVLIVGMDVTIVNVALPAIQKTCMHGWPVFSGFSMRTHWWWRAS